MLYEIWLFQSRNASRQAGQPNKHERNQLNVELWLLLPSTQIALADSQADTMEGVEGLRAQQALGDQVSFNSMKVPVHRIQSG